MQEIKSEWFISKQDVVKYIPEVIDGRISYAHQILPIKINKPYIDEDGLCVNSDLVQYRIDVNSIEEMLAFMKKHNIEWNGSEYSNISNQKVFMDASGLSLYKIHSFNDKGETVKIC